MEPNMEMVEVKYWVKRGGMLVNTTALDIDDPDHVYNQILSQGKRPEDYGYRHPLNEEFGDKTRDELIAEIVELRKEMDIRERYGAMWGR
jgi:hypothetical protein